jgi:hypothetical protein
MYFYEFLLYLVQSELVGDVEMLELRTWYKKVTRDDWLQLMCCTLSDFHHLNLRGVGLEDLRQMRERLNTSRESKSIFELANYMEYYSLYAQGCGGVQGFQNSGCQ